MKITNEELAEAVKNAKSRSEAMKILGYKNVACGTSFHLGKRIKSLGLDISHFDNVPTKGCPRVSFRKKPEEILCLKTGPYKISASIVRREMIDAGIKYECSVCGNDDTWMGKPITIEIDHINGNPMDNRIDNLRFICPNCHSQTPNFRVKNAKFKTKVIN